MRSAVKYRLGIDYDEVKKVNPRIIYGSIAGFGQDGPYANRPGYDFAIQGMSGFMGLTGEPDGPPTKMPVALVDEIQRLKREKNAVILAHNYMTPDIFYGVADIVGEAPQVIEAIAALIGRRA